MKLKLLFTLLLFALFQSQIQAQVEGLWEVSSVQVGTQTMTPVAKWTNIKADGSYESGNGWLQNSSGSWEFDPQKNEFSTFPIVGFEDEFGPFTVEIVNDDEMKWSRMEEGEMVIVVQKRIDSIPKSPATLVTGLWIVEQVFNDGSEMTEEFKTSEFQGVFIRWDNLIQEITSDGRVSGIWRVDAHRPVIDILYYDEAKPLQYWELEFENDDSMKWTRDGMSLKFERLSSFPED